MDARVLQGTKRIASLIESIYVEVGEIRSRLVQVVVKWGVETAAWLVTPHMLHLLVELLACEDLLSWQGFLLGWYVERASLLSY